ncbi:hypothetical protein KY347_05700 [Candidatus Woesearchaeota archaeon]|nr:hypothetical protein [Candidatus Woesearchaeota archaeon]
METKILNIVFVALIALMVIFLAAIVLISAFGTEKTEPGLTGITGAMQSYEVSDEVHQFEYASTKTSKRYDDKYFKYLEHIQERRDRTFFR